MRSMKGKKFDSAVQTNEPLDSNFCLGRRMGLGRLYTTVNAFKSLHDPWYISVGYSIFPLKKKTLQIHPKAIRSQISYERLIKNQGRKNMCFPRR